MERSLRQDIAAVLLLATSFLPAVPANAQVSTPDTFTARVAGILNSEAPPQPIRIVSPLTLQMSRAAGGTIQINLDRIYAACQAGPARCPDIIRDFAARTATFLRQPPDQPYDQPAAARLRAVVRPEAYVRHAAQLLGGKLPAFSGALPPGLLATIYLDEPTAMRLVNPAEFPSLHLSPEQAFATALQNTAREWQPLAQLIKPLAPGEVGGFRGGAYESSRLLLPGEWARAAAQFGGHLLVAVPSAEEVLYANGASRNALPRLAALAQKRFTEAERPTSPAIYQWQPGGWIIAAP